MGFINDLGSLLEKKTYRNFTLYDFSNLVKLKMYVFEKVGAITYHLKDILPAQINPDNIRRNYHKRNVEAEITAFDTAGSEMDDANGEINMQFDFSIEDEYDARTMGGKIPIPLNINEITIIDALYKYIESDYVVVLKWGSLNDVVRIKRVDCNYKSFSPFGEALSAEVDVTFSNADDVLNEDALLRDSAISLDSKADSAFVRAGLAKQYAETELASVILPSVIPNTQREDKQYDQSEL